MQEELNILTICASDNLIKIKEKKTSYDFPSELSIQGFDEQVLVVQETKHLGVLLSSKQNQTLSAKKHTKISGLSEGWKS